MLAPWGLSFTALLAAAILPLSTAYSVCEYSGSEAALDDKFANANQFYITYVVVSGLAALIVLVPCSCSSPASSRQTVGTNRTAPSGCDQSRGIGCMQAGVDESRHRSQMCAARDSWCCADHRPSSATGRAESPRRRFPITRHPHSFDQ